MALLGLWNANFLRLGARAVVPYADALRRFPAHVQQLEMESNGKAVTLEGVPLNFSTGASVRPAAADRSWRRDSTREIDHLICNNNNPSPIPSEPKQHARPPIPARVVPARARRRGGGGGGRCCFVLPLESRI